MNKDILYYIWLSQVFNYADFKVKCIMDKYKNIGDFYKDKDKAKNCECLTKQNMDMINRKKVEDYQYIIDICNKKHIHIVCYNDDIYPKRLKDIDAPPPVLYYTGNLNILNNY